MTEDETARRRAYQELYERHRRQQLARISTGGYEYIHDRVDPQAQLARRIGAALVEAGFTLYDRVAENPLGGAMIMPRTDPEGGVYVGWTIPDALSNDDSRPALRAHISSTMNKAVRDVLEAYGFDVGEHHHPLLVTLGPDPERALEEELDELGEHVVELCNQVRPGSHIPGEWPEADQIAVALVLLQHWHIQEMNRTPRDAARELFDGQDVNPLTWIQSMRTTLGLPTRDLWAADSRLPITALRVRAEGLVDFEPTDEELAAVWSDEEFAAEATIFGWDDAKVLDRLRTYLTTLGSRRAHGRDDQQDKPDQQ